MKKCNMRQAEKTLNKIHNSSFEFINGELVLIEYDSFPSAKEMENLCLFFDELRKDEEGENL